MNGQPKNKSYALWAIVAGVILVIVSIMGWSRGSGGGSNVANQPAQTSSTGKKELTVSKKLIQTTIDAALTENPALRENLAAFEKQYEQGAISQEMIVAEAIEDGLAAKDPIVRNRLSELFVMTIYHEADMGVTPEAEQKYFEENKNKYSLPERCLIRQLFVRVTNVTDDQKARATLDRLFKDAQLPESRQPEAIRQAIAPTWVTREELRSQFGPNFSDMIFARPVGKWSDPYQSTSGWHRFEVLDHQSPKTRSFEEVQAEVTNDLRSKLRIDAYQKELERLSRKYNVTVGP